MVFSLHVAGKDPRDGRSFKHASRMSAPEVEEVPVFATLIESSDYGAQKLGGGVNFHQGPREDETLLLLCVAKICRRQLYNWRVGGLIPYFKMGKAVRFRVADVVQVIERTRVG